MSIPYTCPICSGRSLVPSDFYDFTPTHLRKIGSTALDTGILCKTCNGAGIVWNSYDTDHPAWKFDEDMNLVFGNS